MYLKRVWKTILTLPEGRGPSLHTFPWQNSVHLMLNCRTLIVGEEPRVSNKTLRNQHACGWGDPGKWGTNKDNWAVLSPLSPSCPITLCLWLSFGLRCFKRKFVPLIDSENSSRSTIGNTKLAAKKSSRETWKPTSPESGQGRAQPIGKRADRNTRE